MATTKTAIAYPMTIMSALFASEGPAAIAGAAADEGPATVIAG